MVHYKFTYFNAKGIGEVSRQVFALAGQEFEDVRIELEEWTPKLKEAPALHFLAETPFGQMPVLEVDGKKLPQSYAIARYLARTFGFAGKTEWDQAQVDALADQFKDFHTEIRPFLAAVYGIAPGDVEKLKNDLLVPGIEKHFKFFTTALKDSGNGFLVGDSVTYADLLLAEYISIFLEEGFHSLENFPELIAYQKRIHSIPELAKWRKERPHTQL